MVVTLQEASLAARMGDYFYLVGSQSFVAEGDHAVLTTAQIGAENMSGDDLEPNL